MALEKQLNILDYAISSLWRRKFKNISVMLVFSSVIFLIASFQLTTQSLTKSATSSLIHGPEIVIQKMVAGRQESIPLDYRTKLKSIFGIRRVVPRVWGYYFDVTYGANYTVLGIDPELMPMGRELDLAFQEGGFPGPGQVGLGRGVLDSLQLHERKVFSLFKPDLTMKSFSISGVFDPLTEFLTADTMVMTVEDSRDLFGLDQDKVTDFCVYVANEGEIDTIAQKISRLLPDTRVITRNQLSKTYQMVFSWRSGFASVCLLTALCSFIIFAWDKASGLSQEERKEIGILKVLGWQTSDILTMRFWEGFIISSLAFFTGYSLAFGHVVFFSAGLFRPVLVGWSVLQPNLSLAPDLILGDFMLIFCLSVLPYMAATIIPAWRSSIIPPDSAMH